MTYICPTIGLYHISINYQFFLLVSKFLETAKTVWTGHVRLLALTYLALGLRGI
jgi:hypothetical protein